VLTFENVCAGGGGRSDAADFKEGKVGDKLEDHYGWLKDAPKGELNAFRGRRDQPKDEASFTQNKFDPGESFSTKANGLSQLAFQVIFYFYFFICPRGELLPPRHTASRSLLSRCLRPGALHYCASIGEQ
jgi:hypothetical protein